MNFSSSNWLFSLKLDVFDHINFLINQFFKYIICWLWKILIQKKQPQFILIKKQLMNFFYQCGNFILMDIPSKPNQLDSLLTQNLHQFLVDLIEQTSHQPFLILYQHVIPLLVKWIKSFTLIWPQFSHSMMSNWPQRNLESEECIDSLHKLDCKIQL